MEGLKFKAEKSTINMLTGALGVYMTAAMWFEFNDALGAYFGPSMGIIIGTIVFMIYQSNKNSLISSTLQISCDYRRMQMPQRTD